MGLPVLSAMSYPRVEWNAELCNDVVACFATDDGKQHQFPNLQKKDWLGFVQRNSHAQDWVALAMGQGRSRKNAVFHFGHLLKQRVKKMRKEVRETGLINVHKQHAERSRNGQMNGNVAGVHWSSHHRRHRRRTSPPLILAFQPAVLPR